MSSLFVNECKGRGKFEKIREGKKEQKQVRVANKLRPPAEYYPSFFSLSVKQLYFQYGNIGPRKRFLLPAIN